MKKIYFLFSALIATSAVSAQCTDLFISEYGEGSGSNKYLEIYNPTNSTIFLDDYALANVSNSVDSVGFYEFWNNLPDGDSIESNSVYIVCDKDADVKITGEGDYFFEFLSNGDDGFKLVKGGDFTDLDMDGDTDRYEMKNFTVLDVLGDWQGDPGSGWDVAGESAATQNRVLVRKPAFGGNDNWDNARGTTSMDSEWEVKANEDWTNLGMHSSDCHPSAATEPSTAPTAPIAAAEDVISVFSNTYTDVTVDTYRTSWSVTDFTNENIANNDVLKYDNLDFVGIEMTGANSLDISAMENITFNVWTSNATLYRIKIVDFGADNAFGGGDDTEAQVEYTMATQGSWNTHTIALSDLTALTGRKNISQIIFSAQPIGGATLFIDNIYFWKEPTLIYNIADIADVVGLDADFKPTKEDTLYELTGTVYGVDMQGNDNLSFTIIDGTDGIGVFSFGTVDGYVVNQGDEVTVKGAIGFFNGLTQIYADSIRVNSTGNDLKEPTVVTELSEATESDLVMLEKVWLVDETLTVWPDRSSNIDFTNGTDTFAIRIDSDIPGVLSKPIDFDTMNIVGIGGQFDNSAPHNEGYQLLPRDSADIQEWTAPVNSIRDLELITVELYPNPTSGNLTVRSATNWESYEVYNLQGVKVLEGRLSSNTLEVSSLITGSYILKLQSENASGVSRFIVNK